MMKTCTICKNEFPKTLEYFYKHRKDLSPSCKVCRKAECKTYRDANPEKTAETNKSYRLANVDKIKAKAKIYSAANSEKANERTKAWNLLNPGKANAISRAWYLANSEKKNAASKAWALANPDKIKAKNHKRRALKLGNGHTPYTEAEMLERYGTVCYLCNEEIDLEAPRSCGAIGYEKSLWKDHVLALTNGGPDTLDNVKPSHAICNQLKGTKEIYEVQTT